jgi:hypothetical protein
MMKRVEAKDAGAIYVLGSWYYNGRDGLQQDRAKGMELFTRAAELGSSKAHTFKVIIIVMGEIRRRPSSTMRLPLC